MNTCYFKESDLNIEKIISLLEKGEVIAFPTETVYGLGALISNEKALEKIYILKNRPKNKPFIVHISKIEDVEQVAVDIPQSFYKLANYFFPGPLTVILKKNPSISNFVSPYDTVAIRMPAHGLTLKILKALDKPIVGTSANISNEKNPISFSEVFKTFDKKLSAIVDGGICPIAMPSTIVSLIDEPKIIREGFIKIDQILKVIR